LDVQSGGARQIGLIPVEGAKTVGAKRQDGSHVEGVQGAATRAWSVAPGELARPRFPARNLAGGKSGSFAAALQSFAALKVGILIPLHSE
jgi:hypothetical protein